MGRALVFFIVFFPSLSFCVSIIDSHFNHGAPVGPTSPITSYIVITVWPKVEQEEHFAIRTLTRVLGSEEAARKSLIHVYNFVISGFAAKLTTSEHIADLKKQPGILQIIPNRSLYLDGSGF